MLLFALAWYFSGPVYLYPYQFRPALAKSWQARSTSLRSKNQRVMQKMLGPHLSGTQRNTDPPWRSDVFSARGQHRLLPRPLFEKQMLSEQDVSAYCVPSKKQTAPPQMWQHVLPNATFRFFCPGKASSNRSIAASLSLRLTTPSGSCRSDAPCLN
jgi:hypothetical protein